MITRLIVGNFKAIRGPVEIDLRPITLLFGPNAAGKSSILHAVHYAIEILEGRSLNAFSTRLGRKHIDLGGFWNLVHNRGKSGAITLGFEQSLDHESREPDAPYNTANEEIANSPMADEVRRRLRTHRVVWQVACRDQDAEHLAVTECRIEFNEEPIASVLMTQEGDSFGSPRWETFVELNLRHPLFATHPTIEDEERGEASDELTSTHGLVADAMGKQSGANDGWARIPVWFDRVGTAPPVLSESDALPRPQCRVVVKSKDQSLSLQGKAEIGDRAAKDKLGDLLDALLIEPMIHLANNLHSTIHVGPLRSLLPNESGFIGTPAGTADNWDDSGCWYDGTAAWLLPTSLADHPLSRSAQFCLDVVNVFLHENFLMDTGLRLEVVRQRRFVDNRRDVTRAQEHNDFASEGEERVDVPTLAEFVALLGSDDVDLASMPKEALVEALEKIRDVSKHLPYEDVLVLRDVRRNINLTLQDVGTGISQVIPVLIAIFNHFWHPVRMIEQPELHLHPKAQVALGDALIAGCTDGRWQHVTLVETHSEHLLLRLLRRVRETSRGEIPEDKVLRLAPERLSVIYVEPSHQGTQIRRLRVNEQGDFIDRWPQGFFAEREEELLS